MVSPCAPYLQPQDRRRWRKGVTAKEGYPRAKRQSIDHQPFGIFARTGEASGVGRVAKSKRLQLCVPRNPKHVEKPGGCSAADLKSYAFSLRLRCMRVVQCSIADSGLELIRCLLRNKGELEVDILVLNFGLQGPLFTWHKAQSIQIVAYVSKKSCCGFDRDPDCNREGMLNRCLNQNCQNTLQTRCSCM